MDGTYRPLNVKQRKPDWRSFLPVLYTAGALGQTVILVSGRSYAAISLEFLSFFNIEMLDFSGN
jgi:hypothetical protein